MKRRTAIQWMLAAASSLPLGLVRAWAQAATFPGKQAATLHDLAAAALPASLGRHGTDAVAEQFSEWVRNYRAGADLEHGYGHPQIRGKKASPAPVYLAQLETLAHTASMAAAAARPNPGGGPFGSLPPEAQRFVIESALRDAEVSGLPASPDGKHVISDLMSFYFFSDDATDLCYGRAIRKHSCQGLRGSENPPALLPPSKKGEDR
jgi:hypothetical protein